MFTRKTKEDKPVVAICYDFDKTLSPNDMQAQGYIQSVGYDVDEFWKDSNSVAFANEMDQNLAYMYKMVDEARGRFVFNRQALMDYGSKVELFKGVEEWFDRIRQYGAENGVIVEHYIISSGLKEVRWPAQVVNYTNKTQFLFRIEKGVLNPNDPMVNDYIPLEDVRVPFRNMIYIGDSDTDVPCMRLVNAYGGHSIGVYNSETGDKTKVYKMMQEDRIRYFAPADYTDGSELDVLVKTIIDRTQANEKLHEIHRQMKNEYLQAEK